eukprot:m.1099311 g.1099311  ORF g.1099311 m.1099311 type:complete len:71 (-) comp24315_c0_seq58:1461-1673(-)
MGCISHSVSLVRCFLAASMPEVRECMCVRSVDEVHRDNATRLCSVSYRHHGQQYFQIEVAVTYQTTASNI